jgi:hypothetical protein
MTNQISNFYWNANKDNCIAVLNYELQGSAIAKDNTWHNDACPSASVSMIDSSDVYEVFFPSCAFDKDMTSLDKFHIFSFADGEEEPIGSCDTLGEVITFFQSVI